MVIAHLDDRSIVADFAQKTHIAFPAALCVTCKLLQKYQAMPFIRAVHNQSHFWEVCANLQTYQVGARFEALIEHVLTAPLDSRYTQVGFNLVSVQV